MDEERTVVVSGVGPGLGREIAAAVLREGGRVVLGARTEENLTKAAEELDPSGERVAWRVTDITKDGDPQALVAAGLERFGRIDGLVNCAANDGALGGLLDLEDFEDFRRTVETNVVGTMRMTRAAVDALSVRGGSIVFIGTQSAHWPRVRHIAYATSKGIVGSATRNLAVELGPRHIRVNTVVPTWMWGPPVEMYVQWQAAERQIPPEEVVAEIAGRMPLGEIPSDGDVANAVEFFLSDKARLVSGQTLFVNAGEYF